MVKEQGQFTPLSPDVAAAQQQRLTAPQSEVKEESVSDNN